MTLALAIETLTQAKNTTRVCSHFDGWKHTFRRLNNFMSLSETLKAIQFHKGSAENRQFLLSRFFFLLMLGWAAKGEYMKNTTFCVN
jgi:hypothetical protein